MARKDKTGRGVYQYPLDSGHFFIDYYDHTGKRKRETVGVCEEHGPDHVSGEVPCKMLTKASALYRKRKAEVNRARHNPPPPPAKEDLLTDVLRAFLKHSKATKETWKDDLRYARFWGEAFKGKRLDEIRPSHIREWQQHQLATPYTRGKVEKQHTPATVNRYVAFLKHVYFFAMEDGLIDRNPCQFKGAQLKENNLRTRFLTPDEEQALHGHFPPELWHYTLLAIETGLRQSEQMALQWEHVDFGNGILTIPRTKHGEKRHIPLSGTALELLRAIPSRLKSSWVYPKSANATQHVAFTLLRGSFERAVEAAKLGDFHWHDLRHTFASRAVMAGVDLMTVANWLGHKSLAMMTRYAHLAPEHHREALAKVAAKFRSTANKQPTDRTPTHATK